jgi:hypothetical protein
MSPRLPPFAVIVSLATSDIDRNDSATVTFSTYPFGSSFQDTIFVSSIHPTLGLNLHYDVDRHRCQLVTMDPGTPLRRLSQWKSRIRSVYILYIDTLSAHTIADVRLVISEARSAYRQSIIVAFAKNDAPNYISAVGLPQLYFNQLTSIAQSSLLFTNPLWVLSSIAALCRSNLIGRIG